MLLSNVAIVFYVGMELKICVSEWALNRKQPYVCCKYTSQSLIIYYWIMCSKRGSKMARVKRMSAVQGVSTFIWEQWQKTVSANHNRFFSFASQFHRVDNRRLCFTILQLCLSHSIKSDAKTNNTKFGKTARAYCFSFVPAFSFVFVWAERLWFLSGLSLNCIVSFQNTSLTAVTKWMVSLPVSLSNCLA